MDGQVIKGVFPDWYSAIKESRTGGFHHIRDRPFPKEPPQNLRQCITWAAGSVWRGHWSWQWKLLIGRISQCLNPNTQSARPDISCSREIPGRKHFVKTQTLLTPQLQILQLVVKVTGQSAWTYQPIRTFNSTFWCLRHQCGIPINQWLTPVTNATNHSVNKHGQIVANSQQSTDTDTTRTSETQ